MANFLAKIQLKRTGPLTFNGRGRTFKRGQTVITTTDPAEAEYFRSQAGFSVEIKKGKLAAPVSRPAPDDDEVTERDSEDEDESEEEDERDEDVEGGYEEADLKKMNKKALLGLIDDDEDLGLDSADFKKHGKTEIIEAILEAQGGGEEEDDEEEDEDDDG